MKALGVLGFFLALCSLGWQIYTYRESHEERILARLYASRAVINKTGGWDPKGEVAVEVVNIGLGPLYLKRVVIQSENDERSFVFYNADETKGNESPKLLQPRESAKFSQEWDFSEHPLREWREGLLPAGRKEDVTLVVWTTKKFFSLPHPTFGGISLHIVERPEPRAKPK